MIELLFDSTAWYEILILIIILTKKNSTNNNQINIDRLIAENVELKQKLKNIEEQDNEILRLLRNHQLPKYEK